MDPPDLGEARTTIGGGRQERAVIQRDRYEALIGGFVQCLDTVSLAWSVVPSVMRRGRTNDGQVKVHVPLIWFGKVGHDDYRDALITAAWMTFHVSPSSIKGQILVYNYVSSPAWLSSTCSFIETVRHIAQGISLRFGEVATVHV